MKKKEKSIEQSLKDGISDFLGGFGVTEINFGSHKLKIKKKARASSKKIREIEEDEATGEQIVYKPRKKFNQGKNNWKKK